jgi:2-polyprenyl-6-methoxyphenol hydroxylase-like FAD-dependent oxidoreductase
MDKTMAQIDGRWNLEIATPIGTERTTLEVTTDGARVEGTSTDSAKATAIRDGLFVGDRLSFVLDVRRPFKMTLAFDLTVDGDSLSGICKPGRFPASTVTGHRASGQADAAQADAAQADAAQAPLAPQEHAAPAAAATDARRLRVLIAGAGLAGLSAGISLAARGHDVHVLDLDARTEGAQIGISARAVDALHELGVLDAVRERANVLMTPVFTNQFDAHGDPLPMPEFDIPARPDGMPAMVVVYRPILAEILEAAASDSGVQIRRPLAVESFEGDPDGVTVQFSDGTSDRFDLLIGAEGVHSPTRRALFGDGTNARYVGQMSLRWTARDMAPGQGGFYHGPDGATAIVGLMPGGMTYLASGVPMENRFVALAEARNLLRGVLDRFDAPYLRALRDRLTDEEIVIARPYETVRLRTDWHVGRVLVIGDAAHATTPNLSSGGGMALEDGVVLGQEIGDGHDVDAALVAFGSRRRPRADLVVDASLELMQLESSGAGEEAAMPVRMGAMGRLASPY